MKRVLTLVAAGFAMFLVALFAAFFSMRLSIHGRQVDVPSLAGLSDGDAASALRKLGLHLSVENRFFSAAVPPNHVLSQSPVAGLLVRRGGQVRVTESLGAQNVSVPDLTGQTERPASLIVRRLQLDLGPSAHVPAPGPSGVVLSQSPPANSAGIFGPHVSILVSAPLSEAPAQSYIMPSLVGLTLTAASVRLSSAGLHIASAVDPSFVPPPQPPPDPTADPAIAPDVNAPPPPPDPGSLIATQSPAPGHRVSRNDAIRVTVASPASAPDTAPPATPPSSPL